MSNPSEKPRYFNSLEEEELYDHWERLSEVPRVPEWDDFPTFRDFALEKGYQSGFKICRRCSDTPLGPHNYRIVPHSGGYTFAELEAIDRWNKTVNRIRAVYGLPLFKIH